MRVSLELYQKVLDLTKDLIDYDVKTVIRRYYNGEHTLNDLHWMYYLTDEQRECVDEFIKNFAEENNLGKEG